MHEIIDSHCHLDFPEFNADRDQVLARARAAGVKGIVNPGTTRDRWDGLLEIAASVPEIHPALGLHPWFMDRHRPSDLETLAAFAAREPIVAIGEIGLDFQLPDHDAEAQLALCEAQLRLARRFGLPVILHVRKAHDAMLGLLRRSGVEGGICHAFNGSLQQAQQYMKLGFLFGFGGMLTYARSHRLHRLAQTLPLDHIVLETDAPDMAGALHHGERNSPEYLPEVLDALARLREEPVAGVARQTTENVRRLLKLT